MRLISTVFVVIALLGATNAGILNWNLMFKFAANSVSYILGGAEVKGDYPQPQYRQSPMAGSQTGSPTITVEQ
jgi:hypothetical protein